MLLLKVDKKTMSYMIFFALLTIGKSIGLNSDNLLYMGIFYSSLLFLLIKIIMDKWNIKEIVVIGIIFTIIIINYRITGSEPFLFSFLVCIGLKEISIEKLFGIAYILRIIGYITTIILSLVNITPNTLYEFYRDGEYIYRYTYGFRHPNLLHTALTLIVLLYIFLYYKKIKFVHVLIWMAINIFVYTLDFSRTGFIMITLTLFISYFSQNSKLLIKILYKLTPFMQFILMALTVVIAVYYPGTKFYDELNELLTGRLWYSSLQLNEIPTLFGIDFRESNVFFDNSYSMLISLYGIIITSIIMILYYKTAKKLVQLKMTRELLVFFISAIYFISESYIGNALMNLTLIFMAKYLFGELENKNE